MNLAEVINEQKVFSDTRENIRIIYDYCHKNCIVYARKGQIIRVLVNLISNAIQALEESGMGYIRILLKEQEDSYLVSIEDNGALGAGSHLCQNKGCTGLAGSLFADGNKRKPGNDWR